VLLILTGSVSDVKPHMGPRQADLARKEGISVMGIGVGLQSTNDIRDIVRDDDKLVIVRDHLALVEKALIVAGLLCKGETPGVLVHYSKYYRFV